MLLFQLLYASSANVYVILEVNVFKPNSITKWNDPFCSTFNMNVWNVQAQIVYQKMCAVSSVTFLCKVYCSKLMVKIIYKPSKRIPVMVFQMRGSPYCINNRTTPKNCCQSIFPRYYKFPYLFLFFHHLKDWDWGGGKFPIGVRIRWVAVRNRNPLPNCRFQKSREMQDGNVHDENVCQYTYKTGKLRQEKTKMSFECRHFCMFICGVWYPVIFWVAVGVVSKVDMMHKQKMTFYSILL